MKKTIYLSILLIFVVSIFAVPGKITFQGRLTDDGGAPYEGTYPSVVFTLYDAETAGSILWTETQSVTFQQGLFHVFLGDITVMPPSIFDGSAVYLQMEIDGEAIEPRKELSTTPYAFKSTYADTALLAEMAAYVYWDSIIDAPSDFGFERLRVQGETYLTDSVEFVAGENITLEQTGRTITITGEAGSGTDNDWSVVEDDMTALPIGHIAIGTTPSAVTKLLVESNEELGGKAVIGQYSATGPQGWLGSQLYGVYGNFDSNNYGYLGASGYGIYARGETHAAYFEGDVTTTNDYHIGLVGLTDIGTDAATSGASLIGIYDEFDHTDATNVQDAIDDLDAAIGTATSGEGDLVTSTGLTGGADNVLVGDDVDVTVGIDPTWFTGDINIVGDGLVVIQDGAVQESDIEWGLGTYHVDASDIPYDNSTSGLTASDVAAALDELSSEISSTSGSLQEAYDVGADIVTSTNSVTITSTGTSRALEVTSEDAYAIRGINNSPDDAAIYARNDGGGPAIYSSGDIRLSGAATTKIYSAADVNIMVDQNDDATVNSFNVLRPDATPVFTINEDGQLILITGSQLVIGTDAGADDVLMTNASGELYWGDPSTLSASLEALTAGNGLTGTDYDGTAPVTFAVENADGSIEVTESGIRTGKGAPKSTSTSYRLYRH